MEYLEVNGQKYEIMGYAEDGLPIVQGTATSVHEVDEQGNPIYDEEGYPKISVAVNVLASPSKIEQPKT